MIGSRPIVRLRDNSSRNRTAPHPPRNPPRSRADAQAAVVRVCSRTFLQTRQHHGPGRSNLENQRRGNVRPERQPGRQVTFQYHRDSTTATPTATGPSASSPPGTRTPAPWSPWKRTTARSRITRNEGWAGSYDCDYAQCDHRWSPRSCCSKSPSRHGSTAPPAYPHPVARGQPIAAASGDGGPRR
jgi:hypothetical protein